MLSSDKDVFLDASLTGSAAVGLEVVVLAEQRVFARLAAAGLQVEHLARRELLGAHGAGEAAQVVHLVARLPHVVLRHDAAPAPRALRAETPGRRQWVSFGFVSRSTG